MIFEISENIIMWILLLSASFCSFMIGYKFMKMKSDEYVDAMLEWLILNNYVKGKRNSNGEIELFKYDE